MKKKIYMKPAMQEMDIEECEELLQASSVNSNVFNNPVTGGSVKARGRMFNDWDDEDGDL